MSTQPVRTLEIAGSTDMPAPGPHSRSVDGEHHFGLQDASGHDQDSIDPTQPLRRELTLGFSTILNLQAFLHVLLGALMIQHDICKDLRATHALASVRLQQAKDALGQATRHLDTAVGGLPADRPDLLADAQTGVPASGGSVILFLRNWLPLTVFASLEIVTNYLAMQYLRDDLWATVVLAGATSAAILGGCYYIARSSSRLRTTTLGLCVAAVVLGSGLMRYQYALDAVNSGLADRGLPPAGMGAQLAILAFAIGLPAAFGLITIAKTRPEPGEAAAAARRADEIRQSDGVRRLKVIVETCQADVQSAIAEDSAAADAVVNGERALHTLCDQTDASITAEYGRRIERLDAYFRGLALAADDPAMTTRLDRRYADAVKVLSEHVGFAVEEARKQVGSVRAGLRPPAPLEPETPQEP